MRLAKRRGTVLPELNMTPMIDVVFQLLIFFMLCPHMTQVNKESLNLPKLAGSEDQQPTTLTINVNQRGDVIVASHTLSIARLVGIVSRELRRLGGDASRLKLLVRADERGSSRAVNQVVSALSKLGVRQIRIGVQVPE